MNKKRSYWVLFAVMVLVGAFLIVFLGSQNQLPVLPDVDAQINYYSNAMGPNVYNGSYFASGLVSYQSSSILGYSKPNYSAQHQLHVPLHVYTAVLKIPPLSQKGLVLGFNQVLE